LIKRDRGADKSNDATNFHQLISRNLPHSIEIVIRPQISVTSLHPMHINRTEKS